MDLSFALRELLAGLTEPSPAASFGALAVAALAVLLAVVGVDEASVARGDWVAWPGDDHGALAAACLAPPPSAPLHLVFIGSSASREALVDPRALALGLDMRLRRPEGHVAFTPLFAGDLHPVEALALTDCPALEGAALALVDVSPDAVTLLEADVAALLGRPRLPLRSAALEALARRVGHPLPPRRGWPLLDHPAFFLARPSAPLDALRGRRHLRAFHQAEGLPQPTEALWQDELIPKLERWVPDYAARAPEGFALYAELVGALRARGAQVALVERPRNPGALARALDEPHEREAMARYEADLTAFAEAQGLTVLRPGVRVALVGADFRDHSHLVSPRAREAWTLSLVRGLGELLQPGSPAKRPSP